MSAGISVHAAENNTGDTDDPNATAVKETEVTAKGVGVVGGILAGAETVLVVESIIRVKPLWPYIVIPIAGAVGGGIGGYKLEQKTKGGAIALLITSMVGIIPTLIATSSARSFHPEDVGAQRGTEPLPTMNYTDVPAEEISGGSAVVEVEARPDGISETPMGPPSPVTNDGQGNSDDDAPTYELNVEPEGDAPDGVEFDTTAPESAAPDSESPESRLPSMRDERLAHLASGALLHMNRQFRFGLGIPAVDVVPVQLPQPLSGRQGIAFHIPLISLDLP